MLGAGQEKELWWGFTHKFNSVENWISMPGEFCTMFVRQILGEGPRMALGVPHERPLRIAE